MMRTIEHILFGAAGAFFISYFIARDCSGDGFRPIYIIGLICFGGHYFLWYLAARATRIGPKP